MHLTVSPKQASVPAMSTYRWGVVTSVRPASCLKCQLIPCALAHRLRCEGWCSSSRSSPGKLSCNINRNFSSYFHLINSIDSLGVELKLPILPWKDLLQARVRVPFDAIRIFAPVTGVKKSWSSSDEEVLPLSPCCYPGYNFLFARLSYLRSASHRDWPIQ